METKLFIWIGDGGELLASLPIDWVFETRMVGVQRWPIHKYILRVIQIGDFSRKPVNVAEIFQREMREYIEQVQRSNSPQGRNRNTYRTTSTQTEVLVVDSRLVLVETHNSPTAPHASAIESLGPVSLDHIQCQRRPRPAKINVAVSASYMTLWDGNRLTCSTSTFEFCNSKCSTLMPSSWKTCSARASPPTWLFSVNMIDVLSPGDTFSVAIFALSSR